ncbi:methyltransferase domain-containing protein [Moraxella nasibovis]|uniref:methyltransferase domain-containing protein n=1 Tax=Moraxella nasibovis TaxID=2904120 RepID=UPI00240F4E27|nr:methyltransferase domain-containing protein [Moraxella nasibovis]WFF38196.1 methyltransferase domain-containing protein [Moraxella nasibovis]
MNVSTDHTATDRNFDPIADHFAKKVYGGLKGQIRLAVLERDISHAVRTLSARLGRPLKVLDVGAGLAQISLVLAKDHHCTINDISANMIDKAKQVACEQNLHDIRFITCPYQELGRAIKGEKFDLILCHAVLEWLGKPWQIMDFFDEFLADDGVLSLCFYNPASLIYRNLIMGNFYQLDKPKPADNKSLTPNNPVQNDEVESWLSSRGYVVQARSGIRVFSDYTPLKRGGLTNLDAVIDMELRYSQQMPFRLMGRYLHILANKPAIRL